MVTLFPDQEQAEQSILAAFQSGYRRPLLVAPCGFGKGTVAGDIIQKSLAKNSNNRIIFLVNRRELVKDMSKRLTKLGIFHGILMGAQTRGSHMQVLIASQDTLRNRLKHIPAPNLVFVDEAHLFVSEQSKKLIDTLADNGAFVILMTATPWRLDGKGLDQIADTMIEGPQMAELIEQDRLARPEIYAPEQPDLSKVHITKSGEFDEDEAGEAMRDRRIIGDMVKHWTNLAPNCKTVGFAVNRKASEDYAEAFRAARIASVAVDANTPDKDRHNKDGTVTLGRDTVWQKLAEGEIKVVWSVGIISYGWDVPEVDCVIDAAPTMSLAKHLQRIGRASRKHPDKQRYIILDHAGNTIRIYPGGSNGLPDFPREWTLDGRKKRTVDSEGAGVNQLPLVCPACPPPSRVLKPGTKNCPVCGYEFQRVREAQERLEIKQEDGELVKVESRVYIYPEKNGDSGRDNLISTAREKNYHPGWIQHRSRALEEARAKYRAVFDEEPKEYWSAGMIGSMIRQASKQSKLPL